MAKGVPQFYLFLTSLIINNIRNKEGYKIEGGPSHYEKVPLLFWEFVYHFKQIRYTKPYMVIW